jgi:hypothetical protein
VDGTGLKAPFNRNAPDAGINLRAGCAECREVEQGKAGFYTFGTAGNKPRKTAFDRLKPKSTKVNFAT